ncbi:pentatricopeptide repeat-containing protein [Tripterygium wilfordii]|uniref:Pentatricopeptide repeat-containing protein n=2 Tax=Tripterygium wilfordii TaxID=458696 RepID=A0A7J7DEW9_TRIWF|nr:pentatricopeptide repeat-containing protein [Tripterygium wilfordii]
MIKTSLVKHNFAISRLVNSCCLHGALDYASSIFHRIEDPNPFIFFTLIKGFYGSSNPLQCLILYAHMLSSSKSLDGVEFSLPSVLKVCAELGALKEAMQIYGQILKNHWQADSYVSNSVVRMFLEIGEIELARRVFDRMSKRDLISWNSMITGYVRAGEIDLAHEIFDMMPERDLVSCNAMIDGYGKDARCELAEEVFGMMNEKDVVTWTSMISAYVRSHRPREALVKFREMLRVGVKPDAPAIVSVLSAIADLGFVEEGKWLHSYICTNKIKLTSGFVGSALIDMYAKCGYIEDAYDVFRSLYHRRNIGDWNSMISGLAMHGLGQEAIEVFLDLERMEISPDDITFLGLLSACSHAGLVNEGQFYFKIMQEKYKIIPKIQHYGCLIDLYGRVGRFEDTLATIHHMPMEADVLAWKAILSASVKHGNVAIGETAALKVIELTPADSSCYILLSNIYAKSGRWDDVENVRLMMKKRGMKKVPGCSSIFVNGKVHEFIMGKTMDVNYGGGVLSKTKEMVSLLKKEGYEPDLTQVLRDVGEDEKERLLSFHSEKMALAFGLIKKANSAPIQIVKNLRICCDCHSFMKLASRIYNRRLIVRDQNRFHHFKDGICSCNDYW